MALDCNAIAEGIAYTVRTALASTVTVYAFEPDVLSYPCVVISAADPFVEYHQTMGDRALCAVHYTLEVFVTGRPIDAQTALADYASGPGVAHSLQTAVESDRTLNGTVADCAVFRAHAARKFADAVTGVEGYTMSFDLSAYERRS